MKEEREFSRNWEKCSRRTLRGAGGWIPAELQLHINASVVVVMPPSRPRDAQRKTVRALKLQASCLA